MKQETLEPIVYNIGDNIRIINPTENQPKLFTTHKVDNNFGVVYYYQLDGKEESIGFSYIKKEEPKQGTLEDVAKRKHRELSTAPIGIIPNFVDGFFEGYKEAEKTMYTEEDMKEAFVKGALTNLFNTWDISNEDMAKEKFQEWFNKIKKQ